MASQLLYRLDRLSDLFPDRLYQLLHDDEHVERLVGLPGNELTELIDYLNDVRLSLALPKYH